MKAIWNGKVIADSDDTLLVENNYYFPPESLNMELVEKSTATTACPWKGIASYYDVVVDCQRNSQAAWYYPDPKPEAAKIKGHIAFWKGVQVTS